MTVGLLSFAIASLFNGGVTQTGSNSILSGTSWPFINRFLMSQGWNYSTPPAAPAPSFPLTELDANGYITSILAGTGGVVNNLLTFEPLSVYSGVYVMDWIGNGTLGVPGNGVNSGWIPNTGYSAANLTSTTGSGRFEFTLQNAVTAQSSFIKIFSLGSPYISQIRIYRKDQEALLDAGQILDPNFKSRMLEAKPGTFRSLGWIGSSANGTNDSNIALWAHRKPRNYYSYRPSSWLPGSYAGSATLSGNTYTVTGTATLSDKLLQHFRAPAAPAKTGQFLTQISNSSVTGQPAQVTLAGHSTVVGDIWSFSSQVGAVPAPFVSGQTYFVASVVDANNVTLSATKGGAAINTTAAGVNVETGLWPSLSIDGGTTNYIISSEFFPYPQNAGPGAVPSANDIITVIYDQATNAFCAPDGLHNVGLLNGVPPEVFVDCCAEMGMNPHIVAPYLSLETGASVDGITDFMTSCASYIKTTYPWMNPLFEPSNEVGFGGAVFFSSFYAPGVAFARWGNITDATLQAYGKWASTLGQAIAPIYGNDWTKFRVMASIQTQPAWSGLGNQTNRFNSTAYVNNNHGGDTSFAAYNWVNRGCLNCYYSPARRFQCQDLIDGFNWTVTNAGNPSGQDTVAEAYVNSLTTGNVPYTAAYLTQIQTNFKNYLQSLPAANKITGMVCYEGGYSPDYLALLTGATPGLPTAGNQNWEDWAVYILNATQTNPCVLTVATYTQNGEASGQFSPTLNPAVVGMAVNALSVTGGMSAMNQPSAVTATFAASSANIVLSSGTYSVGQNICFSTLGQNIEGGAVALPSAIAQGQPYWIVSVSGTTIQISATQGGSPITLTDAGTANGSYPFYAQLCYIITAVSGNQITINYDASAQPAFSSTIFTASISGGNMPVSAVSSGALASGQTICDYTASGAQVVLGGTKTTNNGGGGGVGTYTINQLQNVASQQMAVANGQLEFSFSQHMSNNIRWAGKATDALGTMNTLIANNYYGLASSGFAMENFSNFLYFGGGNVWMVLDPNQYAPATPQWTSIGALN